MPTLPQPRITRIFDALFGRRLASHEHAETKIGVWGGVPVLGLDGLSSSAYGPEAALTILLPLGAAGLAYLEPVMGLIGLLLLVVYFSYLQTIAAYPTGGGSYTVAKENLGERAGLIAAAALLLDYVLNVAVGISAGVAALVSVVPALHAHTVALCLGTLALIAAVNLRGARESAVAFGIPTYLFLSCMATVLGMGVFRTILAGGHPQPVVAPPALPLASHNGAGLAGAWLLLRAFASGCTAMTGVEAVANGVGLFAEPAIRNARRTLTAIVVSLVFLLGGIAFLCRAYGVGATHQEVTGYQSVLSQLVGAIVGRGPLYFVTLGSLLTVLALSANTSFAGFPRLCQLIAEDDYFPHSFGSLGRRLVYSAGIYILTLLAALLLVLFEGITDRLIPLFAMGAFLAFTFSQAGMVRHWRQNPGRGSHFALYINALGALCTGVATAVILIAKFTEGAWITLLLLPSLVLLCYAIHRHYQRVATEIECDRPMDVSHGLPPLVVVPVSGWNTITEKALRFGLRLSPEIIAVCVSTGQAATDALRLEWEFRVEEPLHAAGRPIPQLKVLDSPYRLLFDPLLGYIEELKLAYPDRKIAVIVPELMETHWYEYFLHNQSAIGLKTLLSLRGDRRLVVINVPWYLGDES